MKYIKLFEDHWQTEIPFDGKASIHDKPIHVHVIDALEAMSKGSPSALVTSHTAKEYINNEQILESVVSALLGNQKGDDFQLDMGDIMDFAWRYWNVEEYSTYWNMEEANDIVDKEDELSSQIEALAERISYNRDVFTAEGEEAYKEYIEDLVSDKNSDFYNSIEEDEHGLIKIYRAINFPYNTEIMDTYEIIMDQFGRLGVYWSYEHGKEEAYLGETGDTFTVCALVRPEDINWKNTIIKTAYGLSYEKEIETKENVWVQVYAIEQWKEHGGVRTPENFEEPLIVRA